ncbi:MAG: single-stranded DNA-binding protein [Acetobacteraceae bacterium]
MSGSLNKATLIGNLGREPEVRSTQTGKQVVTLSLATSESWKDDRGNRVERTEWHRVVIWNEGLGKIAERFLAKGSKVYVEGKIVTNKYTDNAGVERYSTEIHLTPYNGTLTFLDNKKDEPEPASTATRKSRGEPNSEDEIPF